MSAAIPGEESDAIVVALGFWPKIDSVILHIATMGITLVSLSFLYKQPYIPGVLTSVLAMQHLHAQPRPVGCIFRGCGYRMASWRDRRSPHPGTIQQNGSDSLRSLKKTGSKSHRQLPDSVGIGSRGRLSA
jgi:hypothetical protein